LSIRGRFIGDRGKLAVEGSSHASGRRGFDSVSRFFMEEVRPRSVGRMALMLRIDKFLFLSCSIFLTLRR
jgi:hypothetical protein